ncbi:hypothetical protein C1645_878362 [Glomus cerebriforme]|uniref:Uncharacterized protein n=1 Tax=Glomus cerebriforme TaxID=658196 RepID=A0A397SW19_9GLOM|nr:hypothetical protein C1645_878362 [Glomus cerebriforme]
MFQLNYPASNVIKINQNNTILIPLLRKTSWGKGISRHMVQCEINYIDAVPVFKIQFGEEFQNYTSSTTSATNAANIYLQVLLIKLFLILMSDDPIIHIRLSGDGGENYEILQRVMTPMVNELNNLVINGLRDSTGKIWTIKPYFSSDWKFLSITLGFNASNSNHFCPWCLCTKKDIGNKLKVCTIEKNLDQLESAFFNHHSSVKPPPDLLLLK